MVAEPLPNPLTNRVLSVAHPAFDELALVA